MPREDFDLKLNQLQSEVETLAQIVGKSINRAVDALKRRDLVASQEVINDDDYIDHKRFAIEERCADMIATQQPMAGDLRAIIALLHIVVELERMGDRVACTRGCDTYADHQSARSPGTQEDRL